MIKISIVSIIIMLYLKKSVSTLQKRNYAPKKIKTFVDFNIHQNHQQPPSVFGARCVSRSPMKCLKHVLKFHVQYLPKYSYTRYIHPLLARTRSPKYNKAQSKRKANPREANTSKHRRHLSLV